MKIPDSLKKYFPHSHRTDKLSVLGKSYQSDWNAIAISFIVVFLALCVLAGVCYYWISVSIFPEDLVPDSADSVDTTIFTHDKTVIEQTQALMEAKTKQFDAARGIVPPIPAASTSTATSTATAAVTSTTTASTTARNF